MNHLQYQPIRNYDTMNVQEQGLQQEQRQQEQEQQRQLDEEVTRLKPETAKICSFGKFVLTYVLGSISVIVFINEKKGCYICSQYNTYVSWLFLLQYTLWFVQYFVYKYESLILKYYTILNIQFLISFWIVGFSFGCFTKDSVKELSSDYWLFLVLYVCAFWISCGLDTLYIQHVGNSNFQYTIIDALT